jgi:hypothetical protein
MFDDMLKKSCPYHKTPVNHTLEQCDMLKKYYSRAAMKDGEAKKDSGDGDGGGFPAVENVFLIFGGPTVDMSNSQRKRERHKVLAAEKAPPSFLDWSGDAITFSREDHLNCIPNPGKYPLVVDLVIGNSRFSKVMMDGGNNLNILYAHTLRLMGIGLDQLRLSTMLFHGVAPGKRVQPLGQIDLPVWFGIPDSFRKETEGPKRRTREGGSEWEPIKIFLEEDESSNKMNTTSNTSLRLTTQIWPSPRSHWSATGPRNQHTTFRPKNAAEHKPRVYRPTPVRPVSTTSQTGPCW